MARSNIRPIVADLQEITAKLGASVDIVLDFTGIVSATASYLKRTILWLHDGAKLAAEGNPPAPPEDPAVPLDIFIFVAGLGEEVRDELTELLHQHNRTCLEVSTDVGDAVTSVQLLGPLDDALAKTLNALSNAGRATATELHQAGVAADKQKITVNAWNNRLNDLYCKRLARRAKAGRHWVYEPVAKEIHFNG